MADTSVRENYLIFFHLMQHKLRFVKHLQARQCMRKHKFSRSKKARVEGTLEKREGEKSWEWRVEAERRKDEGQAGELIKLSSIKPDSEEASMLPLSALTQTDKSAHSTLLCQQWSPPGKPGRTSLRKPNGLGASASYTVLTAALPALNAANKLL